MTDIVERLRKAGLRDGFAVILYQHVQQAADEIERLRAESEELRKTVMTDIVERLRRGVDTNEPPDKTDRVMTKAADEIERLRAVLKGVEIALARDEDIDGAMKLIVAHNHH